LGGGGWPIIIWETTTAKRNYVLHRPTNVLFYINVGMRVKVSAQSFELKLNIYDGLPAHRQAHAVTDTK